MEYGTLIREEWTITWRYRFLWVLGLLAGGAAGLPGLNGGAGGAGSGQAVPARQTGIEELPPAVAATAQPLFTWVAENMALVIALATILGLLVIALVILSFIAQGGMAEATAELAVGQTSSFSRAWKAGLHLFWRYVGLWLLLEVAAIVVAGAIAFVIAVAIGLAVVSQSPSIGFAFVIAAVAAVVVAFDSVVLRLFPNSPLAAWAMIAPATLFALPLFTVLISAAIIASIVVAFAQRATAVENVGPIDALRSGWRLMRTHLGDSLMTWLINVGLSLACGIVCISGVVGTLVVLASIGALVFAAAGLTAPTLAYLGFGVLVPRIGAAPGRRNLMPFAIRF